MVAKPFDVSLSHASEEYTDVALPLQKRLEARGVRVWLDRDRLDPGAFLASGLHDGLSRANVMLALISPLYLRKYWTEVERNAVYALEAKKRIRFIPVLHEMGQDDLLDHDVLTAGRLWLTTADGLDAVAARVASLILPVYRVYLSQQRCTRGRIAFVTFVSHCVTNSGVAAGT